MKKKFLCVCFLSIFSLGLEAQEAPTTAQESKEAAVKKTEVKQKSPRPTSRPRKAPKKGRVNHWGGKYNKGMPTDAEALIRPRPQIETILKIPLQRRMEFWLEIFVESGQIDTRIIQLMALDLKAMPVLSEALIEKIDPMDEVGAPSLIALVGEHSSHKNIEHIHRFYKEGNELVKYSCAMVLRNWKQKASSGLAVDMLNSNNAGVQANGAALLGEIGDTSAVDGLLNVLASTQDRMLRYEITRSLGKIGDLKAMPQLKEFCAQKKDRFLARTATQAICKMSGTEAQQFMQETWQNNKDPRVRFAALVGMHRLGLRTTEELLEVAELEFIHPWLREQALRTWAQSSGSKAADKLLKWVETKDAEMAEPAMLALQEVNLSQHSGQVLELLSQASAPNRSRALYDALVKSLQASNAG